MKELSGGRIIARKKGILKGRTELRKCGLNEGRKEGKKERKV